jgi:hypothetical protein
VGRGRFLFKESEAKRLIRVVLATGLTPKTMRLNAQGELVLELGGPSSVDSTAATTNEWTIPADDKTAS